VPNVSTFYFAWASSGEGFSGAHLREDELIFKFELKHEEGQFAELELEILNPYVGLLAPGRPLWAWFSWSDGSGNYPLFYGRLVAVPDDLFEDVVKIKLVAKPPTYAAQRAALAESLKVLPFYDPVFVNESKEHDPDVALEGYSALWHVDRFAQGVTISDIIAGEDGTVEFTQNEVFYDKVKMKLAGAPLLMCEIQAEVEWTQCDHTGVFEMKTVPNLEGDPKIAPGITANTNIHHANSQDLTHSSPQVKTEPEKDPTQTTYQWEYKNITPGPHKDGDLMEESGSITIPFYGGEMTSQSKSETYPDPETGQGEEYSIKESYKSTEDYYPPATPGAPPPPGENPQNVPKTDAEKQADAKSASTEIAVELEQDRKEGMYVAMLADVQPVLASLTEDEEDLVESLTMNGRDVVAAGAATASDGVYFSTARGMQSVEYLLMVARAHLLAGSRVVAVEWECPFPKLVYSGMSCRMNATIDDPRLPGGIVLGKVVSYEFNGDGDDGEFVGKVEINCAVGNAASGVGLMARGAPATPSALVVLNPGVPVYVEEGYVDPGYQHYAGRMIQATTADTAFEELAFAQVGLQLPITEDQILVRHEYHDGGSVTSSKLYGGTDASFDPVRQALQSGASEMRRFEVERIGTMITSPPASAMAISDAEISFNQAVNAAIRAKNAAQTPTTPVGGRTPAGSMSWVEMEFRPVQRIGTEVNYETTVSPLAIPMQVNLGGS
jgi:hypothetical protein